MPVLYHPLSGRADKKFCNYQCKNRYHAGLRLTNLPIRQRIDRFLHRNHTILVELEKKTLAKRWSVTKSSLYKKGFRFTYYTSSYLNSRGKTYFYVYNFRWMEFGDGKVLVIKND